MSSLHSVDYGEKLASLSTFSHEFTPEAKKACGQFRKIMHEKGEMRDRIASYLFKSKKVEDISSASESESKASEEEKQTVLQKQGVREISQKIEELMVGIIQIKNIMPSIRKGFQGDISFFSGEVTDANFLSSFTKVVTQEDSTLGWPQQRENGVAQLVSTLLEGDDDSRTMAAFTFLLVAANSDKRSSLYNYLLMQSFDRRKEAMVDNLLSSSFVKNISCENFNRFMQEAIAKKNNPRINSFFELDLSSLNIDTLSKLLLYVIDQQQESRLHLLLNHKNIASVPHVRRVDILTSILSKDFSQTKKWLEYSFFSPPTQDSYVAGPSEQRFTLSFHHIPFDKAVSLLIRLSKKYPDEDITKKWESFISLHLRGKFSQHYTVLAEFKKELPKCYADFLKYMKFHMDDLTYLIENKLKDELKEGLSHPAIRLTDYPHLFTKALSTESVTMVQTIRKESEKAMRSWSSPIPNIMPYITFQDWNSSSKELREEIDFMLILVPFGENHLESFSCRLRDILKRAIQTENEELLVKGLDHPACAKISFNMVKELKQIAQKKYNKKLLLHLEKRFNLKNFVKDSCSVQ